MFLQRKQSLVLQNVLNIVEKFRMKGSIFQRYPVTLEVLDLDLSPLRTNNLVNLLVIDLIREEIGVKFSFSSCKTCWVIESEQMYWLVEADEDGMKEAANLAYRED